MKLKILPILAVAALLLLWSGLANKISADNGSDGANTQNANTQNQNTNVVRNQSDNQNTANADQTPISPVSVGPVQQDPSQPQATQPQPPQPKVPAKPVQTAPTPAATSASASTSTSTPAADPTAPASTAAVPSQLGVAPPAGYSYVLNTFSARTTALLYELAAILALVGMGLTQRYALTAGIGQAHRQTEDSRAEDFSATARRLTIIPKQ